MTDIINKQYVVLGPKTITRHFPGETYWAGYPPEVEARLIERGAIALVEPKRKSKVTRVPEVQATLAPPELPFGGTTAEHTVELEGGQE